MPDTPIDFFDNIAVGSTFGLTVKRIRGVKGNVRHGVRQVDEEGVVFVFLDKLHRSFRDDLGVILLILRSDLFLNDFGAFVER